MNAALAATIHCTMFTSRPIGFVSSPYKSPSDVPKGLGAKHNADGVLKILAEFEAGLADIEGFSHLIVIWEFDRSQGFELTATPPSDNRTHGVFATRSPLRPNPIACGLSNTDMKFAPCATVSVPKSHATLTK